MGRGRGGGGLRCGGPGRGWWRRAARSAVAVAGTATSRRRSRWRRRWRCARLARLAATCRVGEV
eukprot:scaffold65849_cov57-Phaeocystis_antarctica.AAC.1